MTEALPKLIWAQRFDKVFVTFEQLNTTDVKVTFSEGLLSLEAETATHKYQLENMALWAEIDTEESKWSANDRAVVISLKKKDCQWWDALTKEKQYKKFIKADFSKWCDEEDKEYTGGFGSDVDHIGGGGMDMSQMMGGMDLDGMMGGGGMGSMPSMECDDDDEDNDADLKDLNPPDLPPLEGDDAPPPLEGDDAAKMVEVD